MSRSSTQLFLVLALIALSAVPATPQSTGSIAGTINDPTGAVIANASITCRNEATGEERTTQTDTAGIYLISSLPVGRYRVEAKAPGMQPTAAVGLDVAVSTTTRQDFSLKVSTASQTVEINAAAPLVDTSTVSAGDIVNQKTVQEIPLNGRHFVDLALLVPGTVTPPANGFLTAPLRGQGSFAFNSAGGRESSVNFMVNGINLSDPNQNQVTFQPTINTLEELRIDNQTFSAEYGRNSGSIVNLATRQGTNALHGEFYEFLRNNALDARNFSNPNHLNSGGVLVANPQSPFIRNQFGGDGGGALIKDKFFVFLTYEGLRQRQSVPLSATTLSAAQRTQAASSSQAVQKLLTFLPLPNEGSNQFVGSAVAPVNIEQGTADVSYVFNANNRANFYYAIQRDERNEPPSTDGNSFPGGGDRRNGNRQLLTFNETWAASPSLVNEARLGFNRIHILFNANTTSPSADFGINNGGVQTVPQITISGNFTFGGVGGFPQGRGDNVEVLSDTLSWVRGNHTLKFGGEVRRQNSDNFSATPGTFTFASVTAFLADQATGFTSNTGNRSNRTYATAVGAFVTDSWRMTPTFTANLGLRYDWFGTPVEAAHRFVEFDPTTVSLVRVGTSGGPAHAYDESALNFQPRVGLAWDPFRNGRTVVRAAYAIMTDQPTLGLVTALAGNPPFALPVSFSPTAAVPFVTLENAYSLAGALVSPGSVAHSYKTAYVSEWNFNIEQQLGQDSVVKIGYYANKGTDLNMATNYNQPVNGVKPYPALSASSPINPGMTLGNITVYNSIGNSSYNGLWLQVVKRFSRGLQLDSSYTFSKSIDYNSLIQQGVTVQDSRNIRGDRGLSDFDARNRFVLSAVYALPFTRNRLVSGWQISLIETLQSGQPINFRISTTTLSGGLTVIRPYVTGPIMTGYTPATNAGPSAVTYIQNPQVFFDQGATGFGTLGRNVVQGPGFSNLDFAIWKDTKIRERFTLRVRAEAFDLLNQVNFTNPVTTITTTGQFVPSASTTFGLITGGTRFPAGDFGTSRQLQISMRLSF